MNREKTVMAVLIGVLIALGSNIGLTVRDSERISAQFSVVCQEHRALAQIAKEEVDEEALNARLLPRVSIPGLTAKELAETSLRKIRRNKRAFESLEAIRRATC